MKKKFLLLLAIFLLLAWVPGCAPSRAYHEGVLAEDIRGMSETDLRKHASDIRAEIARVEQGGVPPAGAAPGEYLSDLRRNLRNTELQIQSRASMDSKSEFSQDRVFPLP